MKPLHLVGLLLLLLSLSGCANQPLQHTYEGDVHVRWLEITMQPLELHNNGVSGDFARVTRIQKVFQNLETAFSEEQNRVLYEQLNVFQQALVQGILEASEIPLVASEAVDIQIRYDDFGQLVGIIYEFPREDGAYMNLYGNIYYTNPTSNSFGWEGLNASEVRVRPKLSLRIDGYTANRELFWRHSVDYESNVRYRFGNNFILGLSTTKMEDGEVFLLPLANGVSEELRRRKARGEL